MRGINDDARLSTGVAAGRSRRRPSWPDRRAGPRGLVRARRGRVRGRRPDSDGGPRLDAADVRANPAFRLAGPADQSAAVSLCCRFTGPVDAALAPWSGLVGLALDYRLGHLGSAGHVYPEGLPRRITGARAGAGDSRRPDGGTALGPLAALADLEHSVPVGCRWRSRRAGSSAAIGSSKNAKPAAPCPPPTYPTCSSSCWTPCERTT